MQAINEPSTSFVCARAYETLQAFPHPVFRHDNKISTNTVKPLLLKGHTAKVVCVHFTNKSKNLVLTASADKSIRLWHLVTGRQLWKIKEFSHEIKCLAVHPEDDSFCAADHEGNVILFDVLTGAVKGVSKCLNGQYSSPAMMVYAAKGTRILLHVKTSIWPGIAPAHVAVYDAVNFRNLGIPLAFSIDRNIREFSADGNSCLIWKHTNNLDTFRDLFTLQWEVWDISILKDEESDYFTDPPVNLYTEQVGMDFYENRKSGPVDYRPRDQISYKIFHVSSQGKRLRRFFVPEGVSVICAKILACMRICVHTLFAGDSFRKSFPP